MANLLPLEGSASIRNEPQANLRLPEQTLAQPVRFQSGPELHWIQEIHRGISGQLDTAAYRNRACDTLHPGWAIRAGTAKRSRPSKLMWETLGHRRLFSSDLCSTGVKQEPLQRRFSVLFYLHAIHASGKAF